MNPQNHRKVNWKWNEKLKNLELKLVEAQDVAAVSQNVSKLLKDRVKELESNALKSEQYSRRECIDISGMDNKISDENLEVKVCEVLEGINVNVNAEVDIQACHRYGRNKNIIVNSAIEKS